LTEAAETVTELLVSASGDFSPQNYEAIGNLVTRFITTLSSSDGDPERRQMPFKAKKLEQTINVGAQRNMSSTLGLTGNTVDLESANARKMESKVDKKKLEKAERKIRAKQDKKSMKNVTYDEAMYYEEFFMAVNPLQMGSDSQAKSKDIKLDNIDISISGLRILTDAAFTLAYGRRYGLVGQNGIGKSTLLRALSRREIPIPTHVSILHVEQEVCSNRSSVSFSLTDFFCTMCGGNIFSQSKRLVKSQDITAAYSLTTI
jgi:ATP-binding cassette subfamily F protein 3